MRFFASKGQFSRSPVWLLLNEDTNEEREDGSTGEEDEGRVLQGLPHQFPERLLRLLFNLAVAAMPLDKPFEYVSGQATSFLPKKLALSLTSLELTPFSFSIFKDLVGMEISDPWKAIQSNLPQDPIETTQLLLVLLEHVGLDVLYKRISAETEHGAEGQTADRNCSVVERESNKIGKILGLEFEVHGYAPCAVEGPPISL